MTFSERHLQEAREIIDAIDVAPIERMVSITGSFMVGDRWRDIEAGRRAGCRTILIGDGYGETFPCAPTMKLASLPGATSWIIQRSRLEREIT